MNNELVIKDNGDSLAVTITDGVLEIAVDNPSYGWTSPCFINLTEIQVAELYGYLGEYLNGQ